MHHLDYNITLTYRYTFFYALCSGGIRKMSYDFFGLLARERAKSRKGRKADTLIKLEKWSI